MSATARDGWCQWCALGMHRNCRGGQCRCPGWHTAAYCGELEPSEDEIPWQHRFVCSEPWGHPGDHHASDGRRVVRTWPVRAQR